MSMDINEIKELWEQVKLLLKDELQEHVYNTWIMPIEAVNYENNTLVLLTPQQLAIDLLKKNWTNEIKTSIQKILGEDATFSINYDENLAKLYTKERRKEFSKQKAGETEDYKKEQRSKEALAVMQSSANLNLNLKFDNFVVGDNSKFAYNAAFAVANNPAKKFNPLFIYGESGLGKTHLLQAIGHYIIFNKPELRVRYVGTRDYCNEWIKCFQHTESNVQKNKTLQNAQMRKFHQKFENIDVLLIDDIQFIESKCKTMEEFFSTFEALYTKNKQIVITSDKSPKNMKLDKRLSTRFEMGLVVDITPPDFQTRFEIVKEYSKELNIEVNEEVCKYIAENYTDNVRELKGALNKVVGFAEIFNLGITLSTAQKALKCEIKKNETTCENIAKQVCSYFDIDLKDLKGIGRTKKIAKARHIAIYLCREVLQSSYEAIGEYFNKKHTTIMYSYELIMNELKVNNETQNIIKELKNKIKG